MLGDQFSFDIPTMMSTGTCDKNPAISISIAQMQTTEAECFVLLSILGNLQTVVESMTGSNSGGKGK